MERVLFSAVVIIGFLVVILSFWAVVRFGLMYEPTQEEIQMEIVRRGLSPSPRTPPLPRMPPQERESMKEKSPPQDQTRGSVLTGSETLQEAVAAELVAAGWPQEDIQYARLSMSPREVAGEKALGYEIYDSRRRQLLPPQYRYVVMLDGVRLAADGEEATISSRGNVLALGAVPTTARTGGFPACDLFEGLVKIDLSRCRYRGSRLSLDETESIASRAQILSGPPRVVVLPMQE